MDKDRECDTVKSIGGYAGNAVEQCRPMTESEIIDDLFDYHAVGHEQIMRMNNVREAAKYFCKVLVHNVPACSDRGSAVEGLRLAVMMANVAISRDGRPIVK